MDVLAAAAANRAPAPPHDPPTPTAPPAPKQVSIEHTTKAGKKKQKTEYDPGLQQPIIYARDLTEVTGSRYERRPSKIAYRAKKRSITELFDRAPDAIGCDCWEEPDDDMSMPLEVAAEDCGWEAGPLERETPAFKGPTPGPTDPSITSESSEPSPWPCCASPAYVRARRAARGRGRAAALGSWCAWASAPLEQWCVWVSHARGA